MRAGDLRGARDRDAREALEQLLPVCPGCSCRFEPCRAGQVHCRPSCRLLDTRRGDQARDLFCDGERED
jgi:hypothetical protein